MQADGMLISALQQYLVVNRQEVHQNQNRFHSNCEQKKLKSGADEILITAGF